MPRGPKGEKRPRDAQSALFCCPNSCELGAKAPIYRENDGPGR